METVYRDYSSRGVQFFYLYKALAHPETNGYVTPYSLDERLRHVAEARRTTGSAITWLCDTMTNDAKHALGDAPNAEFIFDREGKVVVRRAWSNPQELRRDLEQLVGTVDAPTTVEQLNLPVVSRTRTAPRGVAPRVQVPANAQPLLVEPQPSTRPFYVKLRAEADRELLRQEAGTLFLSFTPDPLYSVHWNNLDTPLRFEVHVPDGWEISPKQGKSPVVDELTDADPREFLLQVRRGADSDVKAIELTVDYLVCQDNEAACLNVQQKFRIRLEVDRDGGRVQRRAR